MLSCSWSRKPNAPPFWYMLLRPSQAAGDSLIDRPAVHSSAPSHGVSPQRSENAPSQSLASARGYRVQKRARSVRGRTADDHALRFRCSSRSRLGLRTGARASMRSAAGTKTGRTSKPPRCMPDEHKAGRDVRARASRPDKTPASAVNATAGSVFPRGAGSSRCPR